MDVRIRETGKLVDLSIRDPYSGTDCTQDMIGNAGALTDGQFVWDDDADVWRADEDTVNWWAQYISDTEQTWREATELADELGVSVADITERIDKGMQAPNDYETHRRDAVRVLAEIKQYGIED